MPEDPVTAEVTPREAYVVTCSEPDATPFLAALGAGTRDRAVLLATGDVVRSAEVHAGFARSFVVGGPGTFAEARRLLSVPGMRITVVVGPDPWGPFKGKGYVRARQVAPLILPDVPVDVIELQRGGVSGRVRRATPLPALSRWIRRREAVLLAVHVLRGGRQEGLSGRSPLISTPLAVARLLLALPVAGVTLARCLTYVARTEARVRRNREGS